MDNYQSAAMRTCALTDRKDMLRHAIFGLTSEAGECAGIMQKVYQGHADPFGAEREHMIKELGDCLWMIAEACQALGCTINDAMELNIAKLITRYPDGFNPDRSRSRKGDDL